MAKICIDPGHCKKQNRSPGIPEYYESEMVWKLSNLKKNYLLEMGNTVIMTRTDPNKDLALLSRGKKSAGCDLFESDHSNAVGSYMDEKRNNIAIYHLVDDHTTNCDDISKKFAEGIGPVISAVMELPYKIHVRAAQSDRNGDGFKNDNYYGVLEGAHIVKTPGVILEHGFHTHTQTVRWLLEDANLDRLARAEAEFTDRFFKSLTSQEPEMPASLPQTDGLPYKVQVVITNLNIRKGPGVSFARTGFIDPGTYTIVEEQAGWGRLKSGAGWIYLAYANRK